VVSSSQSLRAVSQRTDRGYCGEGQGIQSGAAVRAGLWAGLGCSYKAVLGKDACCCSWQLALLRIS
jgi:hypothetical protein